VIPDAFSRRTFLRSLQEGFGLLLGFLDHGDVVRLVHAHVPQPLPVHDDGRKVELIGPEPELGFFAVDHWVREPIEVPYKERMRERVCV
jgi:hypothetical protein